MALLKVASSSSRSGLSPTVLSSFALQGIWRSGELSTNVRNNNNYGLASGEGGYGQQRIQQQRQQRRGFAKEAVAPKTATPNAAKNVKAKNTTKKEEKKEQRERFTALIDACLDAPPPVKVLKEKERLRLLEREKLGIASPELLAAGIGKQQQQKARGKAAAAAAAAAAKERMEERERGKVKAKSLVEVEEEEEGEDGRDGVQDRFVSTEMAEMAKVELTAEEGKRLAKQCSRVLFREERERSQGEVIRLRLKQRAIAALPEHLREAALVPDLTPFPRTRIPASLTPPIQGYIEDRAQAQAQAVTVKKSR